MSLIDRFSRLYPMLTMAWMLAFLMSRQRFRSGKHPVIQLVRYRFTVPRQKPPLIVGQKVGLDNINQRYDFTTVIYEGCGGESNPLFDILFLDKFLYVL